MISEANLPNDGLVPPAMNALVPGGGMLMSFPKKPQRWVGEVWGVRRWQPPNQSREDFTAADGLSHRASKG